MNSKTYNQNSTVSTSSQTNQTVSSFNVHSLTAGILKTLALKIGNDINDGTIAPSTRRSLYDLSSKILFEQYYRPNVSGPRIAMCETTSSNVSTIDYTSCEQNNFCFLHDVQEAMDVFNSVLDDFGVSQKLELYDPEKHPTQPNSSHHSPIYQPGFS